MRTKGSKNKEKLEEKTPAQIYGMLLSITERADDIIVAHTKEALSIQEDKISRLYKWTALVAGATAVSLLSIFLHFSRVLEIIINK